jgi:hypothetical protein
MKLSAGGEVPARRSYQQEGSHLQGEATSRRGGICKEKLPVGGEVPVRRSYQ